MTASNWKKILKQLENKPAIKKKFIKHCKPKERTTGKTMKRCENCGRFGAHIGSYNLNLCRHCFRELAEELGFEKYS